MKTSRRDLLRGAALTGAMASAGALSACGEADAPAVAPAAAPGAPVSNKLTLQTIAEAEKLQGVTYTTAERAMMLDDLEANIERLAAMRAQTLPNSAAPATVFDPKLPGKSVRSQKNTLTLAAPAIADAPDDDAGIAFASLAQQGAWLRSGAISSVQLTDIYLERIRKYDGKLNSFITVTAEIARKQAQKADKDFADGRDRGPLHGIPYGMKDLADVKGVATSWGAAPYKDRIAQTDAEAVRKLVRAGAVLLGKTACGAIARGDQWWGARTRNPWNVSEGSSGSSAGSAAATAAGLCGFAIGTETLGSIISPSERCGVSGLRPTFGRVSRAGFMALCWSLDKVGPLCRSAEDTALVLSKLNGYDADDPGAARVGFTYDGAIDLSTMVVGYAPQWFEQGDAADRAALEAMKSLGVTLKEFPWPSVDFSAMRTIVEVEAATAFADFTLSDRDDELTVQSPDAWPNIWRKARFISAVDYLQVDRLRRKLMVEMHAAFEGFDALIGPHFAGGALLATNMTGQPQLTVRSGFAQTANRTKPNQSGGESAGETFQTPRAISLWGGIFQEGKIIALGHALETALGAVSKRPPGFSG